MWRLERKKGCVVLVSGAWLGGGWQDLDGVAAVLVMMVVLLVVMVEVGWWDVDGGCDGRGGDGGMF